MMQLLETTALKIGLCIYLLPQALYSVVDASSGWRLTLGSAELVRRVGWRHTHSTPPPMVNMPTHHKPNNDNTANEFTTVGRGLQERESRTNTSNETQQCTEKPPLESKRDLFRSSQQATSISYREKTRKVATV